MNKALLAVAGGVGLVAGAAGFFLASKTQPTPPPVVVVQTPAPPVTLPAPPAAAPAPAPAPEKPAREVAPPTKSERRASRAPERKITPAPPIPEASSEPAPERSNPAPAPAPAPPTVANAEPAPLPPPHQDAPKPEPAPQPAPPRTATIPAGTLITVRLNDALGSERSSEGEAFSATLDAPIVINNMVLAERGSQQRGRVVSVDRAGRIKGRASIALELTQLTTSDGQKVAIQTEPFTQESESTVKEDVAKAGVAAGLGAVIGAIAGGGKGAAIGATIGGAAGAGGAIATRGKEVKLDSEMRISFRLRQPVTLTEKLPQTDRASTSR
jgi:hypothetical protein